MSWKASTQLMETIRHYAKFPATGVSLRQMVQFGEKPSTGKSCPSQPPCRLDPAVCDASTASKQALTSYVGTLFRASQFLAEELPIRLAHRVKELDDLPDGLNEMPSVNKVKDWYAQSFEVCALHPSVRPRPRELTNGNDRKSLLSHDPTLEPMSKAA